MTVEGNAPLTTTGDDAARELRRPRDGRMVAGVCAGLAAYFGLRPAIYRIAFAALALVGGAGLVLYAVAALVIPAEGAEMSIAEDFLRQHRDQPGLLIGLGVIGVLAVIGVSASGPGDWGWPLAGPFSLLVLVVAAGVAVWAMSERDRPSRPPEPGGASARRRTSVFLPGLGLLLVAGGVALLLDVLDVHELPLGVTLAVTLVLAGLLVVTGALSRRVTGLVPLGLVLVLVLPLVAVAGLGKGGPIGERVYHPVSAAELDGEYDVRYGRLELDLRDVELPSGETHVEANVGIGQLVVLVPDGVAIDVTATAQAGDLRVLGRRDDGWDVRERVVEEAAGGSGARLVLDAEVGFGDLEVRRTGDRP